MKFKTKFFLPLGIVFVLFAAFRQGSISDRGSGNDYEQNPPRPLHIWVQKLPTALQDGSNMRLMIKYEELTTLPSTLDVYTGIGQNNKITFRDDGTGADTLSGDSVYSAYIVENINTFIQTIQSRIQLLNNKSYVLSFTGRTGESTPGSSISSINTTEFNNNKPIELNRFWLAGWECDADLIKQNSLFITSLSVVEDPARTYNVVSGTGNASGIWTLGNMMKNMAGTYSTTHVHPRDLMKSWIKNWTVDQTINGQAVGKRKDVFTFLIQPWIRLARGNFSLIVDSAHWEGQWDSTDETALLQKAPFKLTAIVNRQDLRGNTAYNGTVSNSGETRFIFSLIDAYSFASFNFAGMPPVQENQVLTIAPPIRVDWSGMNVIFEYGNVQTNFCQVRDFALRWLDLSNYSLDSTRYNDSLESITKTVINANAVSSKINGSAINRIRTNERIFHQVTDKTDAAWRASDWEFRQFELSSLTKLFAQVTLTNTPVNSANNPYLIGGFAGGFVASITLSSGDQHNLLDWAFNGLISKTRLYNGTHTIPLTYAGSPLRAAIAKVDGEYAHYWDLVWDTPTTHYDTAGYNRVPSNYTYYKQMRHQLSLNTCQGCHASETHTIFTQVRPLGYGQSANYWGSIPDYSSGQIDKRFTENSGSSCNSTGSPSTYTPPSSGAFVNVSPFLTGRNYSGSGSFDDDNNTDTNDSTIDGLFYVFSPDNTFYLNLCTQMYGYNDLERRKQDLCGIIGTDCSLTTLNVMKQVSFIPAAPGSH